MTISEAIAEQAKVAGALMFAPLVSWMDFIAGIGITIENDDYALKILLTMPDITGIVRDAVRMSVSALDLVIPFDFLVTGEFVALAGGPIAFPGAKISRGGNGSGTLGAIVRDQNGNLCLLTCAHVLFGDGDVQAGIDGPATIALGNTVKRIDFDDEPIPSDAGIAQLVSAGLASPSFPSNAVTSPEVLEPVKGMQIRHFGAVSQRSGTVLLLKATLRVTIGDERFTFASCALTFDNFAEHGDSGSIGIDTETGQPVGIVFAKATIDESSYVALCSLSAALIMLTCSLVIQ